MTRKQELQQTISRLVGKAYDQGEQAAKAGKDRHTGNPYEPANPMLAQVYRIGHMEQVARMHFNPLISNLSERHAADARAILATTGAS